MVVIPFPRREIYASLAETGEQVETEIKKAIVHPAEAGLRD